MSYLNELVCNIIDPLSEEVEGSPIVQLANDTFLEFIEKIVIHSTRSRKRIMVKYKKAIECIT